jgi:hypothetical protein
LWVLLIFFPFFWFGDGCSVHPDAIAASKRKTENPTRTA